MPAPYAWKITAWLLPDLAGDPMPEGPRNGPDNPDWKSAEEFRLLDDDRILYAAGLLTGDDYTCFEPLDDYGMPALGCTIIQYRHSRTGLWCDL